VPSPLKAYEAITPPVGIPVPAIVTVEFDCRTRLPAVKSSEPLVRTLKFPFQILVEEGRMKGEATSIVTPALRVRLPVPSALAVPILSVP
jgi:hypothetical protein